MAFLNYTVLMAFPRGREGIKVLGSSPPLETKLEEGRVDKHAVRSLKEGRGDLPPIFLNIAGEEVTAITGPFSSRFDIKKREEERKRDKCHPPTTAVRKRGKKGC